MKDRIGWIDNAKASGIFLVLIGHQDISPLVKQWIYSFHMPLFFFLSGFLFNFEKYNTPKIFFKRKIASLVVPYFAFAFFAFFFWLFVVRSLSVRGESLQMDSLKPFFGIFYSIGVNGYGNPMENALWFLTCLFVVEVLFWFITKFSHTTSIFVLSIVIMLGMVYSYTPLVRLPWSIDVACIALIFYAGGYHYKDKINSWLSLLKQARWSMKFIVIVVFLSLNVIFCILNGRTDMNGRALHNIILFLGSAWMGIAFVLSVCRISGVNKIISFFGKNTLIIMGLSGVALFCVRGGLYLVSKSLFYFEKIPVLTGVLLSLFQLIILVPAISIINKRLSFIIGKYNNS